MTISLLSYLLFTGLSGACLTTLSFNMTSGNSNAKTVVSLGSYLTSDSSASFSVLNNIIKPAIIGALIVPSIVLAIPSLLLSSGNGCVWSTTIEKYWIQNEQGELIESENKLENCVQCAEKPSSSGVNEPNSTVKHEPCQPVEEVKSVENREE